MNLNKQDLVILAKQVAKADKKSPVAFKFEEKNYSFDELNSTLRDQFQALAGTYNDYRRNKNDIFEIMQEVIDEVLPNKIIAAYGEFAEIKQYGQGNKPSFVKRAGTKRAKQFITKVGLAGVYEVFKLDKETFDIDTTAYGGAAQIGLEEFLDGVIDFASLTDIIIEGLSDSVYKEIATALTSVTSKLPAANVASAAGFDDAKFTGLLNVARAYGNPIVYTTLELASKIVPASGWVSDDMRNAMNNQGYVGIYKGAKVVVLPQSFEDETNTTKVFDPAFAYIIPTGADGRPVKIAMEGETIIDEYVNRDRSREIQAYKKFGVGVIVNNDICIFEDTSL